MIGRTIGPYRVESELGAGGMGVVYKATDTQLGRGVALKVLRDDIEQTTEQRMRFEREARALAALTHPHIATIYGVEEIEGRRLIAMELVPGVTLADMLAARPIPLKVALAVCRQIA